MMRMDVNVPGMIEDLAKHRKVCEESPPPRHGRIIQVRVLRDSGLRTPHALHNHRP